MKYPYIGKVEAEGGESILIKTSKSVGYIIKNNLDDALEGVWEAGYAGDAHIKNITTGYLANTYGEVKSKEHAHFIVELGEGAGYELVGSVSPNRAGVFVFDGENKTLFFMLGGGSLRGGSVLKQITIPLPPESNVNTPEEDEKNNGDNLIFGCEDKCKEWPKIGDEVVFNNGISCGIVIGIYEDAVWIKKNNGKMDVETISKLSKPKTPEEELFESFWREVGLFMNQSKLDKGIFKVAFINNITKKLQ